MCVQPMIAALASLTAEIEFLSVAVSRTRPSTAHCSKLAAFSVAPLSVL